VGKTFPIALFDRIDRTQFKVRTLNIDDLAGAKSRGDAGVELVSCLVFDCDRVAPDPERLKGIYWIGHTTHLHTLEAPRWLVIIPLAAPAPTGNWGDVWRRARAALCPEADPACNDPSRAYWLPAHDGGLAAKTRVNEGPLLDASTLPALPPELRRAPARPWKASGSPEAYMRQVLDNVATAAPGGRKAALNHAAWTLGRWVAAGKLEQRDVEDGLYAAAERCNLVADDGQRQCWATIRSGLGAGLLEPIDSGLN
jgi:hypothetical protein